MVYREILETPNQPAGKGVFTFYGSATINAPAERVWSVFRDFSTWPKWNACNPSLVPPSGTNELRIGDMVIQAYRPEPVGDLMYVPCKILEDNADEMRLCWRGCPDYIPYWALLPEKVNRITRLENGKCLFEVYETQGRILAYVIKWVLGAKLSVYAQTMADGLKEYVEGLQELERSTS